MNTNRGIWEDEEVFLGLFKEVAKEGGKSFGNLMREKQSQSQTLSCLPHLALQLLVLSYLGLRRITASSERYSWQCGE